MKRPKSAILPNAACTYDDHFHLGSLARLEGEAVCLSRAAGVQIWRYGAAVSTTSAAPPLQISASSQWTKLTGFSLKSGTVAQSSGENPTKLMDGLFNYLLGKGRRKILVGKKALPQVGIEPLPFACEASALTTEPS